MRLLGIDVGGTFTDLVLVDTERNATFIHKVPTTKHDPSVGAIDGIRGLLERHGLEADGIAHVIHGTTIATNAVLEHDGAVTGMITTEGFRDIIHIGRHQRPQSYSIMQDIPWQAQPLVQRRHRKVVRERLAPPRGDVVTPLDEDGVRRAARELKEAGVEAIAICFLFSYINATHENRAKAIVGEEFPDAFVTTSAGVSPQFREFERFTTAAMNAFIGPKVRRYVQNFDAGLKATGVTADLHIMGSHGGVATAATIADYPVLTLLSGPAAGVLGGAWAAGMSGRDRIITFDAGGTSADFGIVIDGQFSEATARDTWIGGYPVMVPMIDINTIGAGGGSIAHVDAGGALRVGPMSAGSEPGPAAYGKGGTRPTVTDANLVLGRLDKDHFLGGEIRLDEAAAHSAIGRLGNQIGLAEVEAAEGALTIVNSNMANAIRARTVQKGLDPRGFSLVALGGAGPLHAAEIAVMLEIPEVIVPPYPGITSAAGLLTTDLKYDLIKTEFQVSDTIDVDRLNADFAALEEKLLAQYAADGIARDRVRLLRSGDLRYRGQGYELRVGFPDRVLDRSSLRALWEQFHRRHGDEYGHTFSGHPVEIVNIRITGIGEMPKIGRPMQAPGGSLAEAHIRRGQCVFRIGGVLETLDTDYYHRDRMAVGDGIDGPAIVLQRDATTVVPPAWSATVEDCGNLLLRRGNRG